MLHDKNIKICHCENFTLEDIFLLAKSVPNFDYQYLDNNIRAGKKCTACVLDIEYYFHKYLDEIKKLNTGIKGEKNKSVKKFNLNFSKQGLYNILDSISPKAFVEDRVGFIPIPYTKDTEMYFIISNQGYKYSNPSKYQISEYIINLKLYDNKSNLKLNKYIELKRYKNFQIELTQYLKDNLNDKLNIGYLECRQKITKDGVKGTVRMHTKIIAPEGVGSLHLGLNRNKKVSYTRWVLQDYGKHFISITNLSKKDLEVDISYKFDMEISKNYIKLDQLKIKNKYTKLYEIPMKYFINKNNFEVGNTFVIKISSNSRENLTYMILGSKDLKQISIDHLG